MAFDFIMEPRSHQKIGAFVPVMHMGSLSSEEIASDMKMR